MPGYPGRWLVAASFALAGLSTAPVVLWLALGIDAMLMCDPGEAWSQGGPVDRSLVAARHNCRWNVSGTEHVDNPDPARFAVVAMGVTRRTSAGYLRRLLRPATHDAADAALR